MRIHIVLAALGLVGIAGGWAIGRRGVSSALAAPPNGARVPVIVELFSSEGCSSCPPADTYLAKLDHMQPVDGVTVIALEEHVDYWDRLGWRDPFASPLFGERQRDYARVLSDHGVFTPEIVIAGRSVVPGGDEDAGRALLQSAAADRQARVTVQRDGARLTVDVVNAPAASADDAAEVWLAVTESGLATNVPAGENAGRRLAHAPIVRQLKSLGRAARGVFHEDTGLTLDPSWKPGALHFAAFVQLAASRKIVGAGAL